MIMKIATGKFFKLLFGGTIVGGLLSGIHLYEFGLQKYNDLNATVDVTLDSRQINDNEARTIVVCLNESDKELDLEDINIVPTFYNPCDFNLEDFNLTYDVTNNNVEIEHTDFYSKNKYGLNRCIYKYKEKELGKEYESTPRPFIFCKIHGDRGASKIVAKLNYRGSSHPFVYTTYVKYIIEPTKDYTIEQWISKCKSLVRDSIQGNVYDGYYCYNNQIKKEFDIPLKAGIVNTKEEVKPTAKKEIGNGDKEPKKVAVLQETTEIPNRNLNISNTLHDNSDSQLEYNIKSYKYEENNSDDVPYTLTVEVDKPLVYWEDEKCVFYYKYIKDFYHPVVLRNGTNVFKTTFKHAFDFQLMKVLKKTACDNYLEVKEEGRNRILHNKTDNKIICEIAFDNGERTYGEILGNQKISTTGKPVGVFDTGMKARISDTNFINLFQNKVALAIILVTLFSIIAVCLFAAISDYKKYKKETGSSKQAFQRIKRRFSYRVLIDNIKNESSSFINSCYIIGYVFNILTLILIIPLTLIFIVIPLLDAIKSFLSSSLII